MQRKTGIAKLAADPRVEFVDDERDMGNAIIVTMRAGWSIDPRDPHAGVFGADTIKEAWATLRSATLIGEAA